jgi:uridine kinase
MAEIRTYAQLVDDIRATVGPVRLVGIDGCGGAGKTTFAQRLARHGGGWPIIHTDDFASHAEPIEWWPRMLAQVVDPLLRNETARFRPYDWVHRRLHDDEFSVAPDDVVIIEGVGATRAAWRDRLALRIWVDADSDLRLRRGLQRDGEELAEFWRDWRIAEDAYVAADDPVTNADLVVAGDPASAHDPAREFVLVSERRRVAGETTPATTRAKTPRG